MNVDKKEKVDCNDTKVNGFNSTTFVSVDKDVCFI